MLARLDSEDKRPGGSEPYARGAADGSGSHGDVPRRADAMNPLLVWLEFFLALALIAISGSLLAKYGDVIAAKTGLGGTWTGLVLVAIVTSLPELITGLSAVVLVDVPDIAVGTILGSCVFNLVIIVILDFLLRGESVYTRLSPDHVLAAAFGIIAIGVVGFNVLLAGQGRGFSVAHVGAYSPIILVVYLIAIRAVFRQGRNQHGEAVVDTSPKTADITLASAVVRYAGAGLVVVGTATWLPFVGERLAIVMGVHETFVGSLFIALATSLPEVVVTVAAMQIGAFNMALSTLFGSNLFNVVVIVVEDLVYLKAPILSVVSPLHTITAVSAIVMTGIAVAGSIYKPRQQLFQRVGWASLFLLSIYLLNFYVLYLYGN